MVKISLSPPPPLGFLVFLLFDCTSKNEVNEELIKFTSRHNIKGFQRTISCSQSSFKAITTWLWPGIIVFITKCQRGH